MSARGTQKHVAVDMDDVMLDFMGGLQHAVKTEYGIEVPDFHKWEIREVLDPILGKSWWKWMRQRDWLWPNFPALEGAIGGATILRDRGYYVELVTSKPEWAEFAVWKWLGKWRPPFNRVTIVNMDERKVDETEAYILVDDKVESCIDFAEDGRHGVIFDRTHNQVPSKDIVKRMTNLAQLHRAADWQAVVKIVAGLEEK